MAYKLKPIKPKRISDQVFEQLKEMILRGQLKPGEQVTPERELSATLKVSRTTIREAINAGVEFLLSHDLEAADFPSEDGTSGRWFKFGFQATAIGIR